MRSNRWFAVAVLSAVGLLTLSAACTGSDPLNPSSTRFQLGVQTENTATRFDSAFFQIRQITVAPLDPAANSATGGDPLGLVNPSQVYEVNASTSELQFDIPVTLGTGAYRLQSILLDQFAYIDADPPASSATCEEFITVYQPTLLGPVVLTNFGRDVVFSVKSGGTNRLNVTFDGQAFLTAFQSGFFCVSQGQFGCTAPWCLFPPGTSPAFNPAAMDSQAPNFLDFQ